MFCYHYPPASLHPSIASRIQSALELPAAAAAAAFNVAPPSLTCKFLVIVYTLTLYLKMNEPFNGVVANIAKRDNLRKDLN